jgi:hypothetical protein
LISGEIRGQQRDFTRTPRTLFTTVVIADSTAKQAAAAMNFTYLHGQERCLRFAARRGAATRLYPARDDVHSLPRPFGRIRPCPLEAARFQLRFKFARRGENPFSLDERVTEARAVLFADASEHQRAGRAVVPTARRQCVITVAPRRSGPERVMRSSDRTSGRSRRACRRRPSDNRRDRA